MGFYSQPYLTKTTQDGRRLVSWRLWVLIWVAPVLFLGAGLLMQGMAVYGQLATVQAEGEVVRVYEWDGETIFDRGTKNYAPVFRYRWSDGEMTEASTGMSHPDWNFAPGSRHVIRYFPRAKSDVLLPGPHNFSAGWVILAIGLACTLPAAFFTFRLRRWQRAGTQT